MSAANNSLGNITKFSSQGEFLTEYGAIALRFYLLEQARALLPNERIRVCWRYPLPERKAIEIIYSDERQCARSNGTMKCGSGWVCPVCMRYIAERRRLELETAMERSADKWFSVMVTYTSRHTQGDRLKPLLGDMLAAYNSVFSGRWWSDMRPDLMIEGAVRATEITYGDNGWHPHFHVLLFVNRAILDENYAGSPAEYCQSLENHFGLRWLEMLEKHGLSGLQNRAIDVRSADDQIADYIAKYGRMPQDWTMSADAYEISYSTAKTPRNGNFGPLDMLFDAYHDPKMKRLFLEYHDATKGRSALQWSKGLKAALDIEVIRDEIAAQGIETETDRLLAAIELSLWRYIAHQGYIGQLMTIANKGDQAVLEHYLDRLQNEFEKRFASLPQFNLGL